MIWLLKILLLLLLLIGLCGVISPNKMNEGQTRQFSRKDYLKIAIVSFILLSIFANVGNTSKSNESQGRIGNDEAENSITQKSEKGPEKIQVDPGMSKYNSSTGTLTHGDLSIPNSKEVNFNIQKITPSNFITLFTSVFAPGIISSSSVKRFKEWNDGLNYKTRYPNSYAVDLDIGLPTADVDLALELSYKFYKNLYHCKKLFRIIHVYLVFRDEDEYAKGSIQVSLGEKALDKFFSKGDGNLGEFISWVEKNKTPEAEEYAEDEIWINGGFFGDSRVW